MTEDKSDKPVKHVVNFWLIFIGVIVVGLVIAFLLFGLRQGH